MDEQIAEINERCQTMLDELKKAHQEMKELLRSHNITVINTKVASKEIETVLKESQQLRLMSDLMSHHHEKKISENNKSIQASKDNIYKKISMVNAILGKHEITAFEDISNDPPPSPHQFFTGQISEANQYPEASHHIVKIL